MVSARLARAAQAVGGIRVEALRSAAGSPLHNLSSEVLATLVGISEDAAFVKDRDGRYRAINAAGARILARSVAEVVGHTDAELFAVSSAEKMMRRDRAIMEAATTVTYEDSAIVDGQPRWFRSTKGPTRDADGNVDGLWGISRDVTDERRERFARERLFVEDHEPRGDDDGTDAKLAHVERLASLGRLAAVVAHEIRNPLGVIRNAAALAKKRAVTSDGPALFDIIEEEVVRLNGLVEDLLDFARPSASAFSTKRIAPLVKDVLDRVLLGQTPEHVEVRLLGLDSPASAAVDERLFVRALVNVLQNAFEAMPTGGVLTIEIAVHERTARLTICDSGGGFTASAREHLFQPFFTTKATGTGLGLYVVKRIMDDHGGEASVASTEQGTTVSLRLPLV